MAGAIVGARSYDEAGGLSGAAALGPVPSEMAALEAAAPSLGTG